MELLVGAAVNSIEGLLRNNGALGWCCSELHRGFIVIFAAVVAILKGKCP